MNSGVNMKIDVDRLFLFALRALGALMLLAAFLLWALQIVMWLSSGQWVSLDLTVAIALFAQSGKPIGLWAVQPTSWVGLHTLLSWIPTSFVLLYLGFLFVRAA
jgi:hypothetical protein